ncbi:MAG: HPr family phosphocarrier protein [Dysgonamonadaceae bacterium]|jgi:phosphocarrier protein|nr:HPr family phosphocarrier protein [Dysgonamonadaceae bacterium]
MAVKVTEIEIKEGDGLHARPAAELAALARTFGSSITLSVASKKANAGSIISVLALGLKKGSVATLKVEGEDCEEATAAMVKFFDNIR